MKRGFPWHRRKAQCGLEHLRCWERNPSSEGTQGGLRGQRYGCHLLVRGALLWGGPKSLLGESTGWVPGGCSLPSGPGRAENFTVGPLAGV